MLQMNTLIGKQTKWETRVEMFEFELETKRMKYLVSNDKPLLGLFNF